MIALAKVIPALAKRLPHASTLSDREWDSLIVVAIFSGLGLVVSLALLLLDRSLNAGWF